MTGIFGDYTDQNNLTLNRLNISNMNQNEIQQIKFPSLLFGIINNMNISKERKEIKNEEDLTIISYGEIYNEDIKNLDETILNLYKTGNLNQLKDLNGSFIAAIYDKKKDKIVIVNDRYGTKKLFYFYNQDHFCFAPKISILLTFGIKKIIRKDALFDFLIFGFLLDNKTFFENIFLLPSASILEVTKTTFSIKKYWDFEFNQHHYDERPNEILVEDLSRIWRKSVECRIKNNEKIIIPLSGGFDSRAILAAALQSTSKDNIITFTFGEEKSFDFQIGKIIAEKTGVTNILFKTEKKDFESQYLLSLNDTESMIDATPYFAINDYQKLQKYGNRILTGFMGGEIMGSLVSSKMMKLNLNSNRDLKRAKKLILKWRMRYNYLIVKKLCRPLLQELPNVLQSFEKTTQDLNNSSDYGFVNYCTTWLYKNEEKNYTSFCVLRFSNIFNYSIPFLDNNLVDFIMKINPKLRLNKTLYKMMLLKKYPELYELPTKNTFGLKLKTNNLLFFMKRVMFFSIRNLNKISRLLLHKNILFDKNQNYIDYNNLLRTNIEYQTFIRKKIERVKTRNFFDSNYIEKIWRSHLRGTRNYGMLLGLLVTFEMFLENYYDI